MTPHEPPDPAAEPPGPGPSLGEVAWGRLRRPRRQREPAAVAPFDAAAMAGLLAALALAGLAAQAETVRLTDATARLGPTVAEAAQARRGAALMAGAVARPGLEAQLTAIAAHLPPSARLIAAGESASGTLVLELAAADPDAFRAARARDPWFAALRERGQQADDEGGIRVTLASGGE